MRLDVFLKSSRLVIRRSIAQQMCDAGRVSVNDAPAKSSRAVKTGDEITLRRADRVLTVRVRTVPESKQVARHDAPDLYEILSDTPLQHDD